LNYQAALMSIFTVPSGVVAIADEVIE